MGLKNDLDQVPQLLPYFDWALNEECMAYDECDLLAPFIDAGNISTSPLPRFDNLRFGAGVGVRYHTRFGPIRVDLATPINPAPGDPRIAVYVSLGQAF